MKIPYVNGMTLTVVELPLVAPFATSAGTVTHRKSLLLKVRGKDLFGFGECAAFDQPFYTYETVETALYVAKQFLLPEVSAFRDFGRTEIGSLGSSVRGHPMAKAMVENALLDLLAKTRNQPLYELIEGEHKKIRSGIAIGTQPTVDRLLQSVDEAVKKKYHRVKIKVKPGNDVALLEAIRASFPSVPLSVDANGCYLPDDNTHLKGFDAFALEMIEQPLGRRDFAALGALRKSIGTPICLDESIEKIADIESAVALDGVDIVNIKQARVGGLLSALAMAKYCVAKKIPAWCGGMLDLGIGRAVNLHLQTTPGFSLPGDISETARYLATDIVTPPAILDDTGQIEVPPGPGIGVEVNEPAIKKFCVFKENV